MQNFLQDETNLDAMKCAVSEIVKDLTSLDQDDVDLRSSESSEIILSDDELLEDDLDTLSRLSSAQFNILESSWSNWPFPSLDVVKTLSEQTSLR